MTEIDEFFAPLSPCGSARSGRAQGAAPDQVESEVASESKREFLVYIINQGKADKLPGKTSWTVNRIRKATEKVVEKLYHEYHQADAKHKAEMTGKAVSGHVVSMYSKGVSRVLKIDSVEQLRKDIDNDPIIKEFMAF